MASSRLSPSSPPPLVDFSSAVHRDLLSDPAAFIDTARLSVAEFTLLHAHIHQYLLRPRTYPNAPTPHSHSMPTELTSSDQLLLWLFYLAGDRASQLSLHFSHLHVSTVYRIIDHVTFSINTALDDMIAWPSSGEREILHGRLSVCDGAVAVLDGTHCPIQAPTHYSNTYYSGYKCKHTQNYLVLVDWLGMVLHIDGPHAGRENDRADYKASELFTDPGKYVHPDEYILADGGFIDGPQLLVPIHSTVINNQTDEDSKAGMTAYNKEFTANRLIVEDVFGWLKARACVLNTAWPRQLDRQATIFNAACRLHNFARMLRMEYAMQLPATDPDHSE